MKLQTILTSVMAIILGTFSAAWGATLFEETLAVPKTPRGPFGPRGMMGDFLVLW
jgi:hypothetical protein